MKLTVLMCFLSLRVTANHSGGVTLLGKRPVVAAIRREYKDRLFNFLFGSEENKALEKAETR